MQALKLYNSSLYKQTSEAKIYNCTPEDRRYVNDTMHALRSEKFNALTESQGSVTKITSASHSHTHRSSTAFAGILYASFSALSSFAATCSKNAAIAVRNPINSSFCVSAAYLQHTERSHHS